MKKTIFTAALILLATFAVVAQNSKPAKGFIGVSYGTSSETSSKQAIGFDLGIEFFPDSNKTKSFYISTSFNNYDNIIVNYSGNFGMILPVSIIKKELYFYYTPALSFIDCNNEFNFGIYNGVGLRLFENNKSSFKLEGGFTISKYGYAFAKVIYCFK